MNSHMATKVLTDYIRTFDLFNSVDHSPATTITEEDCQAFREDCQAFRTAISAIRKVDELKSWAENERRGYPPSADEYKILSKLLKLLADSNN